MTEHEEVITQDRSTGRIHVRIRRNGILYDNPKCNLDDAGDYRVLKTSTTTTAADFCRNCYPGDLTGMGEDDGSTQPELVP